jgi:hypothetical protein
MLIAAAKPMPANTQTNKKTTWVIAPYAEQMPIHRVGIDPDQAPLAY